MNRSIEFRVWDKDNEEMVSSPITLCRKFDADRGCGEVFVNKIFTDRDYIFMQFTGLTDANGVKIFEGDIVEFYDGFAECISTSNGWELNPDDVRKGVIGYSDKIGSFVILGKDNKPLVLYKDSSKTYHYSIENTSDIQVIGNIFQNPELL